MGTIETITEAIRAIPGVARHRLEQWQSLVVDTSISVGKELSVRSLTGDDCVYIVPGNLDKWNSPFWGIQPLLLEAFQVKELGWFRVRRARFGLDEQGRRVEAVAGVAIRPEGNPLRQRDELVLSKRQKKGTYDMDRWAKAGYHVDIFMGLGLFTRDQIGMVINKDECNYIVMKAKLNGITWIMPVMVEIGGEAKEYMDDRGEMFHFFNPDEDLIV
jgi:hypothetical protein